MLLVPTSHTKFHPEAFIENVVGRTHANNIVQIFTEVTIERFNRNRTDHRTPWQKAETSEKKHALWIFV